MKNEKKKEAVDRQLIHAMANCQSSYDVAIASLDPKIKPHKCDRIKFTPHTIYLSVEEIEDAHIPSFLQALRLVVSFLPNSWPKGY